MSRSSSPSNFSPRANCKILRELPEDPKLSPLLLQVALPAVDAKVHACYYKKRECTSFVQRRKPSCEIKINSRLVCQKKMRNS